MFLFDTSSTLRQKTTEFNKLKSINGQVQNSFKNAFIAHGFLDDDNQRNAILQSVFISESVSKLRYLFAIMLTPCAVSDPKRLWDSHKESLSDDLLLRERNKYSGDDIQVPYVIFNMAPIDIEYITSHNNGKTLTNFGLDPPDRTYKHHVNEAWMREISYRTHHQEEIVHDGLAQINNYQRHVYHAVLACAKKENKNTAS